MTVERRSRPLSWVGLDKERTLAPALGHSAKCFVLGEYLALLVLYSIDTKRTDNVVAMESLGLPSRLYLLAFPRASLS